MSATVTAPAPQGANTAPGASTGLAEVGGGGLVFLASATLVHLGNYAFNLVAGRALGPAAFAEVSLIVTLMLVMTVATAALELVAARSTATAHALGRTAAPQRAVLLRWAWIAGGLATGALVLGAPALQRVFGSPSAWPFVIFGVAVPLYLVQGVHRGVLQGATRFARLAGSFQAEMWARLAVGLGLVWAGFSVNGAVTGIAASFVAAWLVARTRADGEARPLDADERADLTSLMRGSAVLLVGQMLINNSDVLIVKASFPAAEAGAYAAVALIGRLVFYGSWSLVALLFPLVARRAARGEDENRLLWLSGGLTGALSLAVVVVAAIAPEFVIGLLFGDAYLAVAPLLWKYALATGLFAVANAVVNHDLAAGRTRASGVVLAGGILQVVVLASAHETLVQIVHLQIALMAMLLVSVLIAHAAEDDR